MPTTRPADASIPATAETASSADTGWRPSAFLTPQARLADPPFAVDEFIAVSSPVAEEIAVYLPVVPVAYAPQVAVPLAGDGVAAEAAMDADGRGRPQVPLARIMAREGLVGRRRRWGRPRRDYRKGAFQRAVRGATEKDTVAGGKSAEIVASRVVVVKPRRTGSTRCSGSSRG